jgi:hypothetical protein
MPDERNEEELILAELDDVLRSTLAVEPPPGFELGIRRHIAASHRGSRPYWWLAAAAAVAAVVMALPSPAKRERDRVRAVAAPTPNVPMVKEPTALEPAVNALPSPAKRERDRVRAAATRARTSPPEPEVLIAPEDAAALRRYVEAVEARSNAVLTASRINVMLEAQPLQLKAIETRSLEDLPRPKTTDSLAIAAEPVPNNTYVSGGGV